ncbi:MAG: V-type ATP synthase subunit B [Acidimicrobiia bacterium]|nr:V-type ATP synthase subunit B [Acidimicrobiia bacterium]
MSDKLSLPTVELRTVTYVSGPLLFIDHAGGVHAEEVVDVVAPDGEIRSGQVLEVDGDRAVIEVYSGTRGLDLATTRIRLGGDSSRLRVGLDLLGRMFDGSGRPIDGGPPIMPEEFWDVNGLPINPAARRYPSEFIETGISTIDGLNTLARGQKLPIFSGFGLPAGELAADIATHARVPGATDDEFVVVFAAMGTTAREASFFRRHLEEGGRLNQTVLFLNLADDPTIERLLTPRLALTTAEFLAFERGLHVLVILTDVTNYCEALREVATAREEVPGRRGYPGYMYTDLASIFERAGRLHDRPGSVTQLVILSMPDDDITHPIPDLSGYITEGQIVLSRDLHRRGVFPPVDVLPSLSRLMNACVGEGKTRPDHRPVADQVYSLYAEGRDLRRLIAVVGEGSLNETDRRTLKFADEFERRFVHQQERRELDETLDLAWELLSVFPEEELKRIPPAIFAARSEAFANRVLPAGGQSET